jgi:hypothetical protein
VAVRAEVMVVAPAAVMAVVPAAVMAVVPAADTAVVRAEATVADTALVTVADMAQDMAFITIHTQFMADIIHGQFGIILHSIVQYGVGIGFTSNPSPVRLKTRIRTCIL